MVRRASADAQTISAIVRRRSTADELRDIIVRQARQIASLRAVNRRLREQMKQDADEAEQCRMDRNLL